VKIMRTFMIATSTALLFSASVNAQETACFEISTFAPSSALAPSIVLLNKCTGKAWQLTKTWFPRTKEGQLTYSWRWRPIFVDDSGEALLSSGTPSPSQWSGEVLEAISRRIPDDHRDAAAFAGSTKVWIFRGDRHHSDRRGGIVLGFRPRLDNSAGERSVQQPQIINFARS